MTEDDKKFWIDTLRETAYEKGQTQEMLATNTKASDELQMRMLALMVRYDDLIDIATKHLMALS